MKPGIYTMPAENYHSDCCPQPSLSASIAKVLVAQSPLHAWIQHPRLNPAYEPENRQDFDIGTAAHALLLEGENRMEVIDAEDYRKKAAQEARDLARERGKTPVLPHQAASIKAMVEAAKTAISGNPDFGGITLADGKAEQVLIWQDGGTWCRSRVDWLHDGRLLMLDYKTTKASANPEPFTRQIVNLGYDLGAAFYLRGLAAIEPDAQPKFVLLVQETDEPFACSFVGLDPAFIACGAAKAAYALETWKTCMASGRWPGYSPRICWVSPPAWEQARQLEREETALGNEYDIAKMGWSKKNGL